MGLDSSFFFPFSFGLFSPILKGDGGEGKMYSNIQNSLQVPALIKPCEAHYWGSEGCCFCPHFTLFCQGIASRNMQSVQSSCSTLVIGVNWGCSNSSTSAFLLLSIGFSTLAHAANLPWGHWVCWTQCDSCGVIEKQSGWWGEIFQKDPLREIVMWSNGDEGSHYFQPFLFAEFSHPPEINAHVLRLNSLFKGAGLKISNAVVCSCSSFPVSAKRIPFLLPLVRNFCREVVSKRQVFMRNLAGNKNTKFKGLRAPFWSNSPLQRAGEWNMFLHFLCHSLLFPLALWLS